MERRRDGVRERNGVRLGQRVRDLDGNVLGRVTALWDWAFRVERGFPILFRRRVVAGYDEVREARGDALILARSSGDLFALARGELPPSWQVPAAHPLPAAATPPEARSLPGGPLGDSKLPPETDPPRYPKA